VLHSILVCCILFWCVAVYCRELQSVGLLLTNTFAQNGSYIIKVMSF